MYPTNRSHLPRPFGWGPFGPWAMSLPGSRQMFVFSVGRLLSRRCHSISAIPGHSTWLVMPSADFRYAMGSPCGLLSLVRDTQRISRGNPGDFRCTTVGYTRLRKTTDRGLRRVLPARPVVTKPVSAGCSSARIFALGFFQGGVTASPLPSASLRLRQGWHETLV